MAHGLGHSSSAHGPASDGRGADRLRAARRGARLPLGLGQRPHRLAARHRVAVPLHRRTARSRRRRHAVARPDRHDVLRRRLHRAAEARRHRADPRLPAAGADRQGHRLARRHVGRTGRSSASASAGCGRSSRCSACRTTTAARAPTSSSSCSGPVHRRARPSYARRVLLVPGGRLRAQARERAACRSGSAATPSGLPAHGPLRRRVPRRLQNRSTRSPPAGARVRRAGDEAGPRPDDAAPVGSAVPRSRGPMPAAKSIAGSAEQMLDTIGRVGGDRRRATSCSTRSPPAVSTVGVAAMERFMTDVAPLDQHRVCAETRATHGVSARTARRMPASDGDIVARAYTIAVSASPADAAASPRTRLPAALANALVLSPSSTRRTVSNVRVLKVCRRRDRPCRGSSVASRRDGDTSRGR